MKKCIFTEEEFKLFKEELKGAEAELRKLNKKAGEAAAGQDGWHSETYKLCRIEELILSKRVAEIRDMRRNAVVIRKFEEQDKVVKIGNGVLISVNGGSPEKYYLGGFRFDNKKGHLSVQSPLGKCLVLGSKNDVREFKVGGNVKKVKIIDIILPSRVEQFLGS